MIVQTVMDHATRGFAGHVHSVMKNVRSLGQTGTVTAVQETLILYTKLSSQCAHGNLSIARKPIDRPKILNDLKNITLRILNFIPVS